MTGDAAIEPPRESACLRELCEKATPGPWEAVNEDSNDVSGWRIPEVFDPTCCCCGTTGLTEENAAFIVAAVSAVREGSISPSWQPMETAPKDGTTVDLWSIDTRLPDAWFEDGKWKVGGELGDYVVPNPTHWMPLPAPPSNGARSRQDESDDDATGAKGDRRDDQ